MPNQKHGQPQGRQNGGGGGTQGGGGGGAQGVSDQAHGIAQQLQEGASQVGERVREGLGAARDEFSHRYRAAEGMIARNPSQSVLVGFGVGFGLGVLLTVLLTRREEESWYDRYVPDSVRNLPERFRHMHVPESIARHMPGH